MSEQPLGIDRTTFEEQERKRYEDALSVTASIYAVDKQANWLDVTNAMRKQLVYEGIGDIASTFLTSALQESYRLKVIGAFNLPDSTTFLEAHMVEAFARDELRRQEWASHLGLDLKSGWDEIIEAAPEDVTIARSIYRYHSSENQVA